MCRVIKKILIVSLAIVITFCSCLSNVIAQEQIDNDSICEVQPNPDFQETFKARELTSRREKNVKQFYLGNGDVQMISFGKSVHRQNEKGEWLDIDNNLSMVMDESGKKLFSTKDGCLTFTSDTSECAMVSIRDNKYSIAMSFVNDGFNSKTSAEVENYESPNPPNQFESVEEAIDYYNSFSSKSTVSYYNICDDTDLEFILFYNDIKSNIVIHSADVSNMYFFKLYLEDLVPLTQESGQLFLVDETTGELVYEISSPYMVDAKGEISRNITQTISELEDNSYLLTIEVDYEWINNQDRSFPITIDPYLSESSIFDTYINSSSPSQNYGDSLALNISGTCTSYFRHSFLSIPEDSVITQAYFYVAYYFDSNITSGSAKLGLYQVMQDWSEYTWTWNEANQYTNLGLSTTMTTSTWFYGDSGAYDSTPDWETFTITNIVNAWFNGTSNCGFAVKLESGTLSSVHIKSYESGSTYRPYYVILYREPIITEGVYYIKKYASNLYLETDNGSYTSGTLVKQKNKVNGDIKQLYKITYIDTYNNDRFYDIRPMTNNGLGLYAPYISSSNHDVKVNTMSTGDGWYDVSHAQKWAIQTHATLGYVTLHNALNNNGGYLSSPNSSSGTTLVTTSTYGASCRWVLEPYNGETLNHVEMTSISYAVALGSSFDYDAIMYDDQIGVNGPVTFTVVNNDYSSTDKATINATTGQLTAIKNGAIKIRVTYTGAPWIWWFSIRITPYYGCKPYNDISSSSNPNYAIMNCHGYALWTTSNLNSNDWFSPTNDQLNQVNTSNDFLSVFKPQFENWLNDNIGINKWEDVTNDGGLNAVLSNNQWLVVMRVGFHPEFAGTFYLYDYHFWYRTDYGEWVNKHGYYSISQKLGEDVPSDNSSTGWSLIIPSYYNSDLVYYRITEE